jgi:hypothetical protein
MLEEYKEERRPRWAAHELMLDLNVESPTGGSASATSSSSDVADGEELFPSLHPDVVAAGIERVVGAPRKISGSILLQLRVRSLRLRRLPPRVKSRTGLVGGRGKRTSNR